MPLGLLLYDSTCLYIISMYLSTNTNELMMTKRGDDMTGYEYHQNVLITR